MKKRELIDLAALSDPTDAHSLEELRQHLWDGDDLVSHCRCEVCDDYVASHSLREVFRGDESWLACIPCWEYETGMERRRWRVRCSSR